MFDLDDLYPEEIYKLPHVVHRYEYAVEVEGIGWAHGFGDQAKPESPAPESQASGVYHSERDANNARESLERQFAQLNMRPTVFVRRRVVVERRTDWRTGS